MSLSIINSNAESSIFMSDFYLQTGMNFCWKELRIHIKLFGRAHYDDYCIFCAQAN